ncbi:MAG: hypothetical protein PHE15_05325 [Dehalococcoidales bacterium]|nr:hypothetical protein [Dehalococcoidales bacterium]
MKTTAFFSSILVFIMFCMIGCATSGGIKPGEPTVSFSIGGSGAEITGRIDNMKVAKTYFCDTSHLFIAGTDQKVGLKVSKDGSILIDDKDFPQASIAEDGTFTLRIQNLPEGHYSMLIQPMISYGNMKIFDRKTKQPIDLFISNTAAESIKIDLGNVTVGKP